MGASKISSYNAPVLGALTVGKLVIYLFVGGFLAVGAIGLVIVMFGEFFGALGGRGLVIVLVVTILGLLLLGPVGSMKL
ncbi:hypothetical protein NBH00_14825 [Paraconexibacter antarcticus]|uniref:Uncharacterized protein n=1 Tax=Paraconexibacter antarcticus TaxID=2949664 RepID=A0ABY5DLD1_9ACTN|nr:hypothetical protein [Paraconexibacter antarcticus]UTI62631.1 hypothetical protein NBH00_14825 [Paraconexibacter antarcticus]